MTMIVFAVAGAVAVTAATFLGGPDFGTAFTVGYIVGVTMGVFYALTRARTIAREAVQRLHRRDT